MGGYVKTGPFVNNTVPGISASFLNNIESVLARGSGDTETGKYFVFGNGYTATANIQDYIDSLSRTSVPVSVVVDEADQAHANSMNAVITQQLTANGFVVGSTVSGASVNPRVGGNYTINY
jgi:hypothetical protein